MAGKPHHPFFIVVGLPLSLTPYPILALEITSRILHDIRILLRTQVTQGSFYITTTPPLEPPSRILNGQSGSGFAFSRNSSYTLGNRIPLSL